MKKINKIVINTITIVAISQYLSANSEYEEWKNSQNSEYIEYKKSIDEEFIALLNSEWKEFETFSEGAIYKKPKPKIEPIIKFEKELPKGEIIKSPLVKLKEAETIKISKPKLEPKIDTTLKTVKINFYGEELNFIHEDNINFSLISINQNSISKAFENLSKIDVSNFLTQIDIYAKSLGLNSWAKYLLIQNLAEALIKDNNKATLFRWYLLLKSGFDVKLAYDYNSLYILSKVSHKIYDKKYVEIDGSKYYILDKKYSQKLNSYNGNHKNANKKLSFAIELPIKLYNSLINKNIQFDYQGKNYKFKAQYSKNLIDFYKTMPPLEYNLYFDTNYPLLASLSQELREKIRGKSEIEAINFLLRFTQKAFNYKSDIEQFHYEKSMFADEVIHYPYSDCEDRAVMFSYLVKTILGLDVVGVVYSSHMATAVALSSNINGESFIYKNKKFTIADPTYINANIGIVIPEYKNQEFKIVE